MFGWNASPGFFYDVTKKMLELLKTMRPSDFPEEMRAALGPLGEAGPIEEPRTYPVRDPPPDPAAGLGPREDADDPFSTGAVFIDDFIVVTPHREGERRAKALGMAMLWVCYQFFWLSPAGFPGVRQGPQVPSLGLGARHPGHALGPQPAHHLPYPGEAGGAEQTTRARP